MRFLLLAIISSLAIGPAQASSQALVDSAPPHWGYEGRADPDAWAELAPACAGDLQSPINLIPGRAGNGHPHVLHVEYPAQRFHVTNNGHTLQAEPVGSSPGAATIDGERYTLLQFHVHTPSEHYVDGKRYAMELHLVHGSATGKTAVVAVLFDVGAANAALNEFLTRSAAEAVSPGESLSLRTPIQLSSLLPASPAGLRYVGSLTTPPCTEGVLWNIEMTPQSVSTEQLHALRSIYPNNSRPLQALNHREVDEESID